jgi:hypothetical protein
MYVQFLTPAEQLLSHSAHRTYPKKYWSNLILIPIYCDVCTAKYLRTNFIFHLEINTYFVLLLFLFHSCSRLSHSQLFSQLLMKRFHSYYNSLKTWNILQCVCEISRKLQTDMSICLHFCTFKKITFPWMYRALRLVG